MMKKILAAILVLVLLTGSVPALAASLIGGGSATAALPNQVEILSVTCGSENVTGVLTDGKASTAYYMSESKANTLMIALGGAAVSDIWLRNGDYSSPTAYDRFQLATTLRVTVYTFVKGKTNTTVYDYAMDENYYPYDVNENWYYGYQRIALPKSFDNVTFIALTVTSSRVGYEETGLTAFSDLMVTSGAAVEAAPSAPVQSGRVPGVLKMRLSTRTGPSTNYTEPGSFHSKGYELGVISQAYDDRNGIWWVQVEFEYKGEPMRAYTGVKRVDVNLQYVPVEEYLGSARINREVSNPWYGPGYNYRKHKNPLPNGMNCSIYGSENGWLLVEYYDESRSLYRRVWVPEEYTSR